MPPREGTTRSIRQDVGRRPSGFRGSVDRGRMAASTLRLTERLTEGLRGRLAGPVLLNR